jgi:hypothetical protein
VPRAPRHGAAIHDQLELGRRELLSRTAARFLPSRPGIFPGAFFARASEFYRAVDIYQSSNCALERSQTSPFFIAQISCNPIEKGALITMSARQAAKRERREARKFGEAYERVASTITANAIKSHLRNPTRFIPEFDGLSALPKAEVKHDIKAISRKRVAAAIADSDEEKDDEAQCSPVKISTRPPCNLASQVHRTKRRLDKWIEHPEVVSKEIEFWKGNAVKARSDFLGYAQEREVRNESFDMARNVLMSEVDQCVSKNSYLRRTGAELNSICVDLMDVSSSSSSSTRSSSSSSSSTSASNLAAAVAAAAAASPTQFFPVPTKPKLGRPPKNPPSQQLQQQQHELLQQQHYHQQQQLQLLLQQQLLQQQQVPSHTDMVDGLDGNLGAITGKGFFKPRHITHLSDHATPSHTSHH